MKNLALDRDVSRIEAEADAGYGQLQSASGMSRFLVVVGLLLGALTVGIAIVGPWIAPQPLSTSIGAPFLHSGAGHWLGTDYLGNDVVSQVLYGGREIVILPVIAMLFTSTVGGLLGIVSGYFRGRVDWVVSRVVDMLVALPAILILLVLISGWGSSGTTLVIAVVVTSGPYSLRYTRAATLQLVSLGYVEHAVSIGENSANVVFREIVPNVAGPLLADGALRLVAAIYVVATASFLGFGNGFPSTNWGEMVGQNLSGINLNAWSVVAPAGLIACFALAVMLLADQAAKRWAR